MLCVCLLRCIRVVFPFNRLHGCLCRCWPGLSSADTDGSSSSTDTDGKVRLLVCRRVDPDATEERSLRSAFTREIGGLGKQVKQVNDKCRGLEQRIMKQMQCSEQRMVQVEENFEKQVNDKLGGLEHRIMNQIKKNRKKT